MYSLVELIEEIDKDILILIFTSKEKVNAFKLLEPSIKDWTIKEYKTKNFEKIFLDVNRKDIKGFCLNYGFCWCKLLLVK